MKKFWKTNFKKNDFQINCKKLFYYNYLKIYKYHIKIRSFESKNFNYIERDLLETNASVSILLFDPNKRLMLFVEQFRIGSVHHSPWTLEAVSGTTVSSNNMLDAIKETKEEGDSTCVDIIKILDFDNSPGISNEKTYIYLGIFDSGNEKQILGNLSEHEEVKTHLCDIKSALQFIDIGIIRHSSTIIAILWLKTKYYDIV